MATMIRISKPESPKDDEQPQPKIQNFKQVASYNWLDERTPTILVPGIPRVWSPPSGVSPLEPDFGPQYIDQNADRTPGSSLQALMCAVTTMRPDFDFEAVDVITDRTPTRRLLGFVEETPKAFRFGITMLGNIALLNRINDATRQSPHEFHGYRESFEQAYTKSSACAEGSTSHHQIVSYDFGGLRFLLRYCVDAFLKEAKEDVGNGATKEATGPLVDSTLPGFQSDPAPNVAEPIKIIKGGYSVPNAAMLELSTRHMKRNRHCQLEVKLPWMWISQTQNFIDALYRKRGPWQSTEKVYFDKIDIMEVGNYVNIWERMHASQLQMLAAVLKDVIKAAKEFGCPCIVRFGGHNAGRQAVLTVSKAEDEEMASLSKDLEDLLLKDMKAGRDGEPDGTIEGVGVSSLQSETQNHAHCEQSEEKTVGHEEDPAVEDAGNTDNI